MTMLRYFYGNDGDYRGLFDGMEITRQGERYMSKCGRHPVLFMSFKDIKNNNWKDAYTRLVGAHHWFHWAFFKGLSVRPSAIVA